MIWRVLGLALLALQLGCASTRGLDSADLPRQWQSWCGTGVALRQRYDIAIDTRGRQFEATGFIVLDPQAETLDAVILSPLGIKLATLHVTLDEVRSLQDPSPLPERLLLPFGLALRRALLLAWPCLPKGAGGEEFERDALSHGIRIMRSPGETMVRVSREDATWSVIAKQLSFRDDTSRVLALTVSDERTRFVLNLTPTEAGDDDE